MIEQLMKKKYMMDRRQYHTHILLFLEKSSIYRNVKRTCVHIHINYIILYQIIGPRHD